MTKYLFPLFFLLLPVFCFAADKIDINTATLDQLDEIVHVGLKIAQKIIDGRPYDSIQDLSRVKGIGGGKYLQDIIDQGLACVNCSAQNTDTQLIQTQNLQAQSPPLVVVAYPTGIVFNEILPSPEGPDETEEWIEIYNQNNFEVDLSGWAIQDSEGKTTTYVFPINTKIGAGAYLVLTRPETKITLNNTGDKLGLFQPDGEVVDSAEYQKSPRGQSYNRTGNNWQWSAVLTPGLTNIIKEATMEKVRNGNDEDAENVLEEQLIAAALVQNTKKPKSFLFALAIALIISAVFTTVFFFLKIKTKKHVGP